MLVYSANVTLNLLQTTVCQAVRLVTIDDHKFIVIFNDNDDKNYSVVNYRFIVFHCSVAMDGCVHNHNSNACVVLLYVYMHKQVIKINVLCFLVY